MLGARGVGRNEGKVDIRLHRAGELHLRLLRRLLDPLQGHLVLPYIDPLILLEFVGQIVDQPLVEILAPQVGVSIRGLDLENAVTEFENRDVEGPAPQVEDGDLLVLLLVEAIGQRRGCRFVDDPKHVEARDLSRVLRRLPLGVVEIGRHRDDRVSHLLPEIIIRRLLHLRQDHRRNLGRTVVPPADRHLGVAVGRFGDFERTDGPVVLHLFRIIFSPDQPLDGINGIFRVGDRLPFGNLPHQTLPVFRKSNH